MNEKHLDRLSTSPFPTFVVNQHGIIEGVNKLCHDTLDIHGKNLVNQYFLNVFAFDNKFSQNDALSSKVGGQFSVKLTKQFSTNDTEADSCGCGINLVVGATDEQNRTWFTVTTSVNPHIEYERLSNTLSRLYDAVDGAGIGIWEYNTLTQQAFFSSKFRETIDISHNHKLTWSNFKERIFVEDQPIFEIFFSEHINHGILLDFEFRMSIKGEIRWLQLKGEALPTNSQATNIMGSLVDCTQAKNTLTALNEAMESKSLAMEAGRIGTWRAELTQDGDWVWEWDILANELFGLDLEDMGKLDKLSAALHPDDVNKVKEATQKSLATGEVYTQHYRAIMPDGEVRYFMSKGKVSQNALGENCRIDGICIDQTTMHVIQDQLKLLNNQLEQRVDKRTKELMLSKEHAEKASQIKSDFLSMMSHELRTPMNAVIGSLDLLTTTKQSIESMDLIDTAKTSAQNLVFILNDILDINKIEAGKLLIEDRAFSLVEIIDNVIKVYIPVANKSNITLEVEEDPSIPMFVKGDAMRVRQILFNLLGNALKFTSSTPEKHGQVKLHAKVIESNEFISTITIEIIDNGIGIDRATQQKLFMPFIQAEHSTTRKYGGTGLGLAICGKLGSVHNSVSFQ